MSTLQKIKKINSDKISLVDWIMIGIVLFTFFLTMFYGDIIHTDTCSMKLLDCIREDNLLHYYTYCVEHPINDVVRAGYYMPIYIIFAIWNLPAWIVVRFLGINMYAVPCFLWCKLLLCVFTAASTYMIDRILNLCSYSKDRRKLATFLFLTSMNLVIPVFAIAQYDIIGIFFILLGIYEYLKVQDKLSWKCLLIFSFAITLKFWALFVFIIVVFLKEKRIFGILAAFLIGSAGTLICKAISSIDPWFGFTEGMASDMGSRFFALTLPGGISDTPIFVVCFVILCIGAYIVKCKDMKEYLLYLVWFSVATYFMISIFIRFYPYWIVLLAPFSVMLIVQNGNYRKLNLILDWLFNICITLVFCNRWDWVCGTADNLNYLILKGVCTDNKTFTYYFDKYGMTQYIPCLFAIYIACGIALLYINHPKKCTDMQSDVLEYDHGLLYLRVISIVVYFVATVIVAF